MGDSQEDFIGFQGRDLLWGRLDFAVVEAEDRVRFRGHVVGSLDALEIGGMVW